MSDQPEPFVHAFQVNTYHDNRGLSVDERVTVAGITPRGFHRFEGVIVIGIEHQTPAGRRTIPHQVRAPMPGIETVVDAFARFQEFMDPAADAYVNNLQRQRAERPLILRAGPPQQPPQG